MSKPYLWVIEENRDGKWRALTGRSTRDSARWVAKHAYDDRPTRIRKYTPSDYQRA